MVLGEAAGVIGTESGSGIVTVEECVVHSCDDTVERRFADACLRCVDIGTVPQVVLFQRLVGEVVCADVTVGGGGVLFRVTSQSINMVIVVDVLVVGGCIFLLPSVCLAMSHTTDALIGKS